MSELEEIIAHGNRGHSKRQDNNWITCADGFRLSVIAGGGAYCQPRPSMCSCAYLSPEKQAEYGVTPRGHLPYEVAHDFPGPYTHVEVGYPSEKPRPWKQWRQYGAHRWEDSDVFANVPVEMVRDLVKAHGGEAS